MPAARPEAAAARPNLVLFLADDLDHTLGSVERALPQTRAPDSIRSRNTSTWVTAQIRKENLRKYKVVFKGGDGYVRVRSKPDIEAKFLGRKKVGDIVVAEATEKTAPAARLQMLCGGDRRRRRRARAGSGPRRRRGLRPVLSAL